MAKTSVDERNDMDLTGDELEARVYELGFHLDPELPQEEVKKTYQDIRGRIAALGTIVAEGEATKVPLAYTISRSETGAARRDFDSAYFCWIAYEAAPAAHEEVSAFAREEKRIIRFIDVRTTTEAAQHAAEMHELFAKTAAQNAQDDLDDAEAAAGDDEGMVPAPVEKEAE